MVNFDKILLEIDEWGKYQKIRFFLLCLPPTLVGAFNFGIPIFNIMPPKHWCKLPPVDVLPVGLQNLSHEHLVSILIPEEESLSGVTGLSSCKMWNSSNWDDEKGTTNLLEIGGVVVNKFNNKSVWKHAEMDTIPCIYGWEYDMTDKWSLIPEWDLVCGKAYIGHLMLTLTSIGGIVGTLIFAVLQDMIGRKSCLFIAIAWALFWGNIAVLAPSIWVYIAISICRSLTGTTMYQVPYILAVEMVGPSKHTFIVNVLSMLFAVGMVLVAIAAWLCRTWRQLLVCANAPWVLLMLLWFLLDESPRWLISKGRIKDAKDIIQKMAKTNGKRTDPAKLKALLSEPDETAEMQVQYQSSSVQSSKETANFFTIWKHLNVIVLALVLAYLWSVNAMVYVGLNYNVQNFGGNVYIVFAIISLIEIPAEFFNFIVNIVGRIWPAGITMAVSGLALLCASAIPSTITGVVVFLAVLSKFCITASWCTLYQIGAEVFPTVLRGTCIGFATMISLILSTLTPFIVYSSTVLHILPMLILGVLSFSGGILTFFLPETLNHQLPESIEDTKRHTGFGCKAFIGNITFKALRRQREKA